MFSLFWDFGSAILSFAKDWLLYQFRLFKVGLGFDWGYLVCEILHLLAFSLDNIKCTSKKFLIKPASQHELTMHAEIVIFTMYSASRSSESCFVIVPGKTKNIYQRGLIARLVGAK